MSFRHRLPSRRLVGRRDTWLICSVKQGPTRPRWLWSVAYLEALDINFSAEKLASNVAAISNKVSDARKADQIRTFKATASVCERKSLISGGNYCGEQNLDMQQLPILFLLTLRILEESRGEQDDKDVEHNVSAKDANVTTTRAERDAKCRVERVTDRGRAVLTVGGVRVGEVTTSGRSVRASPLTTRLTSRSSELVEFGSIRVADDRDIVKSRRDHTRNETGKRVQLVHPRTPKDVEVRLGDRDTAEERKDDQQEWISDGGDRYRWREGGDALSEGDREELSNQDHGELVTRS